MGKLHKPRAASSSASHLFVILRSEEIPYLLTADLSPFQPLLPDSLWIKDLVRESEGRAGGG
jgi:hypothetical protein